MVSLNNKHYYFYIVQCHDNTFYTGFSTNVLKRVATHNAGKGAKYTRTRRPVKLLFYQSFATKSEALSAEAKFKQHTRSQKELFLREHGIFFKKLA